MNDNKIEKRFLDINDCSAYLGVYKNTLYSCINQRRIPYIKCGLLLRFDIKDIDTWLDENRVGEYKYKDIFKI